MSTFPDTVCQKEGTPSRIGFPIIGGNLGYVYYNDFFDYTAGDWTVTEIGAGGTEALRDGVGGQLLITTDTLDDNGVQLQKPGACFLPAATKDLFFECRFQLVTAAKHIQSELLVGLAVTDTTILDAPQNGIYFTKADGSALVSAVSNKAAALTTTASTFTLAPATWYRVGFYVEGLDRVIFYVDGEIVGTHYTTTIPIVETTPTFAVLNGEAGATAWVIDYFRCSQLR